jgi:hypothetical protein
VEDNDSCKMTGRKERRGWSLGQKRVRSSEGKIETCGGKILRIFKVLINPGVQRYEIEQKEPSPHMQLRISK